jgi:hypothetical protein
MSKLYDIKFLENKFGEFDTEYNYPRISLIEGSLIYVEKNTKIELEEEIYQIKQDESINPTYIWGYVVEKNAIYLTRSFGENKLFIFNPEWTKTTEYVKGKKLILENLQEDTFDELFEQKAVFKHFYKILWRLRKDLGAEIRDKNGIPDNIAIMEAQHIIDRIIFTYFICEKGLITEKTHGKISGEELFSGIIGQLSDENESWEYLKRLFFEQFAKSGAPDLDCGADVYIHTPYLNGGLFRPKNVVRTSEEDLIIEFDWNKIFDPLNKYTWIIEDEIPDFQENYEGNLTPEIIGHIYEKFVISMEQLGDIEIEELEIDDQGDLKKGNKSIGAYYTPETITDFISKKTITPYLIKEIGEKRNLSFDELIDSLDNNSLVKLLDILKNIKICDPSCGSGAFLLKAGEILLEYETKILNSLNISKEAYNLKKEIIINNLFGVDLQEGAIEICKLRLWLWLISSAPNDVEPDPLPNIEYNFIVGNSLIGFTNNENITQNILIKFDEKDIRPLISLKVGYDRAQKNKIDEAISLLNKTDVKSYANALSYLKSLYSYSEGDNAEILKITIEWIRETIYSKVNKIFHNHMKEKGVKIPFEELENINPFHWEVDFWEIFSGGGFDVIIGNPPYGNILNNFEKKWVKKTFSCNKAKNIAENFFERTLDVLLKNDQYMGYVIPKTIAFYGSWVDIREKILNKNIKYTFDVGIGFVGVNYEEIVLIVENNDFRSEDVKIFSCENLRSPLPLSTKKPIYLGDSTQKNMLESKTIIFKPINDTEQKIIDQINKNSIKFREIFQEKAFRSLYISNREKEEFQEGPVKWINKVPDVKRYYIDKHEDIKLKEKWKDKAEKIMKPRLFFKVLRGKRLVCYTDLIGEYLTTEKLVNVLIKPNGLKLETLMLIINSYIPSFYIQKMLFSETTETSRVMDDIYVGNIPVPKDSFNQDIFKFLHTIMIYLNSSNDLRTKFKEQIGLIDNLIDCLVYELYLSDELNSNLRLILDSLLSYEKFNDDSIPESINALLNIIKTNYDVHKEIEKINSNEWIKVIEK